ncbi:PrgI family protein [Saccharopolyspora sp. ASAGF58]|uniref:PrgI family protein n=1 Tax=Saccharopolyspora sp. ASAGF58 TaxID=2719023 RepID=UPI0014400491|nr:PrgI family protein [Saccharopolyspora sp. ASAGF58]QIZ37886.1 PrgI family protein [Saccharopolyspora sp. ASAGF58]
MSFHETRTSGSYTVRIPSDVDREDRILANLTARQLAILAVTGAALYLGWLTTRTVVPLPVFVVLALPIAALVVALVLGQRDGVSLDRLAVAALRQRMAPARRVTAPDGVQPAPDWLTARAHHVSHPGLDASRLGAVELPATGVRCASAAEAGVVDLGADGLAVVAVASTVNFALRTPAEQAGLVAGFGRYLHSLTSPIQVLVRAERLDLTTQIADLRDRAGGLPHPALEAAAAEHADYLNYLAGHADLLRRQVLLVLREPLQHATTKPGFLTWRRHKRTTTSVPGDAARRAAEARLVRRLDEATDLLAPAGIVVTVLDAGQATSVLAAACNPDRVLPTFAAAVAGAEDIITTPPERHDDIAGEDEWGRVA